MKNKILIMLFSAPLMALAQTTPTAPDTVITKDAANPNTEYWLIHNSQGRVQEQGKMVNKMKEGLWREYNEREGLLSKAVEYHKGEMNGACFTFKGFNEVQLDETYRNGKKEGPQMKIGETSHIEYIENYHNGVLDGSKQIFYDDSKLKEDGYWKNGLREGKASWYYSSGKPSIEYTYKHGELNGPAKTYNENGNIASEGNYVNNDEDGKWLYYDDDGTLAKTVIYEKGKVIKETVAKKDSAPKKEEPAKK